MEFYQAWNPLRSVLQDNFIFYDIKTIVGLAGLNLDSIAHLVQKAGGGASKGQLMTGIDQALRQLKDDSKEKFIRIVAEEVISRQPEIQNKLESHLNRLGLGLFDKNIIPLQILDITELHELSEDTKVDFIKAAQRLRDGDLCGALSAACGAVDTATSAVYRSFNHRKSRNLSFQRKCNHAFIIKHVFENLKEELVDLGWEEKYINLFIKNFKGALNQSAFILQTLRSNMSDVHGTKPIIKRLIFDSLKWAELIVRTLQ